MDSTDQVLQWDQDGQPIDPILDFIIYPTDDTVWYPDSQYGTATNRMTHALLNQYVTMNGAPLVLNIPGPSTFIQLSMLIQLSMFILLDINYCCGIFTDYISTRAHYSRLRSTLVPSAACQTTEVTYRSPTLSFLQAKPCADHHLSIYPTIHIYSTIPICPRSLICPKFPPCPSPIQR